MTAADGWLVTALIVMGPRNPSAVTPTVSCSSLTARPGPLLIAVSNIM